MVEKVTVMVVVVVVVVVVVAVVVVVVVWGHCLRLVVHPLGGWRVVQYHPMQ